MAEIADQALQWIGGLIVVLAIVSWFWWNAQEYKNWPEVYSRGGNRPDAVFRLRKRMEGEGIRCKVRVIGMGGRAASYHQQNVSLRVHKDDVQRAYRVLAEWREEG